LLVLVGGFCLVLSGWLSSAFCITIPNLSLLWGFMVGRTLVIVLRSLGHWFVFTTKGCAMGYFVLSQPYLHLKIVVV
jgi:hypothetical protein